VALQNSRDRHSALRLGLHVEKLVWPLRLYVYFVPAPSTICKIITTAGIHISLSKPKVHLNNIVTDLLKARTVEPEKQPLLGNARAQK
jgi:hypothetical protein